MSPAKKTADTFTAEERAAMKERAKELKAEAKASKNREAGESDIVAKIAEFPDGERQIAQRVHELITTTAPDLMPRTWYGMPAYAKDDKIVCFFQNGSKFGTRYSTLGFNDAANIDEGVMWPTAFAVTDINDAVEARIIDLVKRAVS